MAKCSVKFATHLILFIYFASLTTTKFIQIILIVYSRHKLDSEVLAPGSNITLANQQGLEANKEQAKKYLVALGTYYREIGSVAIAVFVYSIALIIPIAFYFLPHISHAKVSRYFRESSSISFLTNPIAHYEIINHRLDQFISETIESNFVFVKYFNFQHMSMRRFTSMFANGLQEDSESNFILYTEGFTRQQCMLFNLKTDKSSMWPAHRNEQWRLVLRQFGLRMYLTQLVFFWIIGQVTQITMSRAAFKSLANPTMADRLRQAEDSLLLWVANHAFANAFAVVLVIMKDQLQFLTWMNGKLDTFLFKIDCLLEQPELGTVKFALDRQALELFLEYQLFNSEIRSNLGLLSFILNQYIMLIMFPIISALIVIKSVDFESLTALTVMAAIILTFGNVMSVAYAFINGHCLILVKKCWSLVGRSSSNPDLVMTPHTLLLWRRANADFQQLQTRYTCRVAGKFNVNHTAVIRFNTWLVSLVILFLKR